MISDIVEQLRALASYKHDDLSIGNDAADEIESLRQLVDLWKTTAENQKTALTDLRQRVKELESWQQEALTGEPVPLSERQKMEAELAALKESQGEPVYYEITLMDGTRFVAANRSILEGANSKPLYTSAPTIPEGWQLMPKEPDYSLLLKMTDRQKSWLAA